MSLLGKKESSADLKLKRAIHHIDLIENFINEFLATKPFVFVKQFTCKSDEISYHTKINVQMPELLGVMIGDAVHNLRSSLDNILFELIRDAAKQPEKIQFPVAKLSDASKLSSTFNNFQINFASKKLLDAIIGLKPFVGGNKLLVDLHHLAISDKHRIIPTVMGFANIEVENWRKIAPENVFSIQGKGTIKLRGSSITVKQNIDLSLRESGILKDYEVETPHQPSYVICFGRLPFRDPTIAVSVSGLPVVTYLKELFDETSRAVKVMTDAGN